MNPAQLVLDERVQAHGPKDEDYDAHEWTWCGADQWVDALEDVDHCGVCDKEVLAIPECANTICYNGTPTVLEDDVDTGQCALGPENAWQCYVHGEPNDQDTVSVNVNADHTSNACGAATPKTVPNPCERCTDQSPIAWTELKNTQCCDANGNVQLDAYDQQGVYWYHSGHGDACPQPNDARGIDKNDGKSEYAYWEDGRIYYSAGDGLQAASPMNRYDDYWQDAKIVYFSHPNFKPWWSQNGVCNKGGGARQVAEINANFTPGIDEHDWYGATFSGGTDTSAPNASIRARLISRDDAPGTNRKVRMKMCVYITSKHRGQGSVNIQNVYFRNAGRGEFYPSVPYNSAQKTYIDLKNLKATLANGQMKNTGTAGNWLFDRAQPTRTAVEPTTLGGTYYYDTAANNPHPNSPAGDGRGGCFETDDDGYLDISYRNIVIDGDATGTGRAFFAVSLAEDEEILSTQRCDQLNYTLLYDNDQDSNNSYTGSVAPRRSNNVGDGLRRLLRLAWRAGARYRSERALQARVRSF